MLTTYTEQTTDGLIEYVVNPTIVDQIEYQAKGLAADAKDPSDYLRLVSRTFSSFRDRVSIDNVSAYLNGFEVEYNYGKLDLLNNNVLTPTDYHIFKINAGACFINNQFIEFTKNTLFYKTNADFTFPTKSTEYIDYAIIVTYGFIDQYNDSNARIRIVPYRDLTFTIVGDNHVCNFKDSSLDGVGTTLDVPALLIAKFCIQGLSGWVCDSTTKAAHQIDPQGLDKLYMLNYKLLFEYFGSQAQSVFSKAGLTQATFIEITPSYIDPSVKSGDMVRIYQDSVTKVISYKPALASRQKFDQVAGLYLFDRKANSHILFINGLVTYESDRYTLADDHPLKNNLIPGLHYYMENTASMFDPTPNNTTGLQLDKTNPLAPIIKVGDVSLMDNSGRITTRYYNGSVMVGTAVACNQLLLNINHSMEIGVQGLLELFGDNSTFDKEIKAQKIYHDTKKEIETNTQNIVKYNDKITLYNNYKGYTTSTPPANTTTLFKLSNGSNLFPASNQTISIINKTRELYNYISRLFIKSKGGFDVLKTIPIIETSPSTSAFTTDEFNVVLSVLTGQTGDYGINKPYSGSLLKLSKILDELTTAIALSQTAINVINDFTYNQADFASYWASKLEYENLRLGNDTIGFDSNSPTIENFENPLKKTNAASTYTTEMLELKTAYDGSMASINNTNKSLKDKKILELEFAKYEDNITSFIEVVNSWTTIYNDLIVKYTQNISTLNASNASNLQIQTAALANIVKLNPLALDLFHMDEYQRKVFNYTYVSDRLKRCLYLVDIIQIEFNNVSTDYSYIYNNQDINSGITPLDKILVEKKLKTVTNKRDRNLQLIEDYKKEFNALRNEFGLESFTEAQFVYNLDPGEYVDERIGQYKFGIDDHTNCVNGLCENWLDACQGIIYDEFAIVANQTDINLGKIITLDTLAKNSVIDLFRITDNNALDTNGVMIIPTFTLKDSAGVEVPSTKMSISTVSLTPDKYIVGQYHGYQVKLNVAATMTATDQVYTLTIDTTQHVNTLKLKIKVL